MERAEPPRTADVTPPESPLAVARRNVFSCTGFTWRYPAECRTAVETLWRVSDIDAELEVAATISQNACMYGEVGWCERAVLATWLGRGAPADPARALGWHDACGSACGPFSPAVFLAKVDAPWARQASAQYRPQIVALARAEQGVEALALVAREVAAARLSGEEGRLAADEIWRTMWDVEVAPLAETDPFRALAGAQRLVDERAPAPIPARIAELRAKLAEGARALGGQARGKKLMAAARFHLLRARELGATVVVPAVDPSWGQPVTGRITGLPVACAWLSEALGKQPEKADVTIDASRLSCEHTSKKRRVVEQYVEKETRTETRRVPGEVRSVLTPCDSNNSFSGRTCYRSVQDTRTETVTVEVPVTKTRTVTRNDTQVRVQGTVTSSQGDELVDVTIAGEMPEADAVSKASDRARVALFRPVKKLRDQAVGRESALARAATGVEADEHDVRAMVLGGSTDALRKRYDFDVSRLWSEGKLDLPLPYSRQRVSKPTPPKIVLDGKVSTARGGPPTAPTAPTPSRAAASVTSSSVPSLAPSATPSTSASAVTSASTAPPVAAVGSEGVHGDIIQVIPGGERSQLVINKGANAGVEVGATWKVDGIAPEFRVTAVYPLRCKAVIDASAEVIGNKRSVTFRRK